MERKDENRSSVEKEKMKNKSSGELTDTPSQSVNEGKFVNTELTHSKFRGFNSISLRVDEPGSRRHRQKAEEIAKKFNKFRFREILDIYEFCYDFVENLSSRLGVPLFKVPEEVEKYIQQDETVIIGIRLNQFLDDIKLNGETRKDLEKVIYRLIFDAKIRKKPLKDISRILALIEDL